MRCSCTPDDDGAGADVLKCKADSIVYAYALHYIILSAIILSNDRALTARAVTYKLNVVFTVTRYRRSVIFLIVFG